MGVFLSLSVFLTTTKKLREVTEDLKPSLCLWRKSQLLGDLMVSR